MSYIPPKELLFQSIDYSKPEVIQALLRFYYDFKGQANEDFNAELLCVFVDIDNALKEIDATARQREALQYYMEGWVEEEIGNKMGITRQAANKLVVKICVKISKMLGGSDEG